MALVAACLAYGGVQALVIPSLPVMATEFDVSPSIASWVLTAFLVASCVASPVLGSLGDLLGRRRMLEFSLALLLVGCLVSALASAIEVVIAGRVLQGAAGAVFPLAFAIIDADLPRRRVGVALGLVSSTFPVSGALGMPLGGWILDELSWRWCYAGSAMVAVFAWIAVRSFVRHGERVSGVRIDVLGGLLLGGWLSTLLVAVTYAVGDAPGRVAALVLALVTVALMVGWWRWEMRCEAPMVDPRLLRRAPVPVASWCAFALGWVQVGVISMIPVHLTDPDGWAMSSTAVGLLYVPGFIVGMLAAPVCGALAGRYGYRGAVFGGLALVTLAVAIPAMFDMPLAFGTLIAVAMVGVTAAFAALPGWIVGSVPAGAVGSVTGMNAVTRSIGGACGVQVAGTALAAGVSFVVFLWCSVALALTAVVSSMSGENRLEASPLTDTVK